MMELYDSWCRDESWPFVLECSAHEEPFRAESACASWVQEVIHFNNLGFLWTSHLNRDENHYAGQQVEESVQLSGAFCRCSISPDSSLSNVQNTGMHLAACKRCAFYNSYSNLLHSSSQSMDLSNSSWCDLFPCWPWSNTCPSFAHCKQEEGLALVRASL